MGFLRRFAASASKFKYILLLSKKNTKSDMSCVSNSLLHVCQQRILNQNLKFNELRHNFVLAQLKKKRFFKYEFIRKAWLICLILGYCSFVLFEKIAKKVSPVQLEYF